MLRDIWPLVAVMVTLALLATACGPAAVSDRDVLVSVTDEVIVPAYRAVARDMAQLDEDAGALCNAPNQARLDAARQSWRAARGSWGKSKAMAMGPVMERRSTRLLDWSPTDAEGMERLLAQGRRVTVVEVRDVLASNLSGITTPLALPAMLLRASCPCAHRDGSRANLFAFRTSSL